MPRRSYAITSFFVISLMVLSACTLGQPPQDATAQPTAFSQPSPANSEVSAPATPSPTIPPVPSPTRGVVATPTEAPSPTPFVDRADNPPTSNQVTLRPQSQGLPTPEVVQILTPSIVQIVTETLSMGLFNQPIPNQGVGTGIILDTDGNILTNNHVVSGARGITVTLADGESFPAQIIGTDFQTDLAVIRINPGDGQLQPARLGASSELLVGEDVIAIGHALGLTGGPTVSKGVVSALGRSIDLDANNTIVDLIQTDAEINPGNSGGALVNTHAEVIGINTAIIQSGRGIGFAINVDDAKVIVRQLMDRGFVERGFIGITPVNVTSALAQRFGLPVKEGILIGRVIAGTAAARANLQVEDIIVQLEDAPIRNNGDLSKFLIAHQPGETVEVILYRDGRQLRGEITLGGRP